MPDLVIAAAVMVLVGLFWIAPLLLAVLGVWQLRTLLQPPVSPQVAARLHRRWFWAWVVGSVGVNGFTLLQLWQQRICAVPADSTGSLLFALVSSGLTLLQLGNWLAEQGFIRVPLQPALKCSGWLWLAVLLTAYLGYGLKVWGSAC